jgi:hypothetical protein
MDRPTTPNTHTRSSRITQCLAVDLYNLHTDQWTELKLDNSLLNHHIFHSYYQYNRSQLMSPPQPQTHQPSTSPSVSPTPTPTLLAPLIKLQLTQSKSICALKNLLYILNENCIHCYQFKNETLICLPYFRLPINLSQFILAGAVSVTILNSNESSSSSSSSSSTSTNNSQSNSSANNNNTGSNSNANNECMSVFSWFSDNEEPPSTSYSSITNTQQQPASPISSSSESPTTEFDGLEDAIDKRLSLANSHAHQSASNNHNKLKKEKEALIYLLNPTKSLLYEFYPAKNKFKKLPNLALRHGQTETAIINISSKLYVTGGFLAAENAAECNGSAIEVYDNVTNTWSIFMSKLGRDRDRDSIEEDGGGGGSSELEKLPAIKKFFKLKISLV